MIKRFQRKFAAWAIYTATVGLFFSAGAESGAGFFNPRGTKKTYRLLCIGDSVTLGKSMTTREGYPEKLERLLNERHGSTAVFTVINAGLQDGLPERHAAEIEDRLEKYKPHMIAIMLGAPPSGVPQRETSAQDADWMEKSSVFASVLDRKSRLKKGKPISQDRLLPEAELKKAYELVQHGHVWDAEAFLRQAQSQYPDDARVPIFLAKLMLYTRRPEQAEPFVRLARKLPQNAATYLDWSEYYVMRGESARYLNALENALVLDPASPRILNNLAAAYLKHGDTARAAALLEEGVRLHPRNDLIAGRLATCFALQGRHDEADRWYARADELRRASPSAVDRAAYLRIVDTAQRRGIIVLCVQYPVRAVDGLKEMIGDRKGLFFVDNKDVFREAIKRRGYNALFLDSDEGDFGHCNDEGNRILAANVAAAVERVLGLAEPSAADVRPSHP
jgi:tetratricopeptide (TPR) repeat protein